MSSGLLTKAIAKRSFCCWPPEHLPTYRSANSPAPARSNASSALKESRWKLAISSTVSRTFKLGSRPPDCIIAETRPSTTALRGVVPHTSMFPESVLLRPKMRSMVEVLPAPLGPKRATTSPRSIEKLRSFTAQTSPNDFVSDSTLNVDSVFAMVQVSCDTAKSTYSNCH